MRIATKLSLAFAAVGVPLIAAVYLAAESRSAALFLQNKSQDLESKAAGFARIIGFDSDAAAGSLLHRTLLAAVAGDPGSRALVADSAGRVLADSLLTAVGTSLDGEWRGLLESPDGLGRSGRFLGRAETLAVCLGVPEPETGEDFLLGRRSLGSRVFCLATPLAPVEAGARILGKEVSGVVAVLFFLGLAAAWALARSLLAPLLQLNSAMSRSVSGEGGVVVACSGHDELGELAAAFNAMQARVAERTVSIESRNAILDSMATAVLIADRDGALTFMNKAARGFLGPAGDQRRLEAVFGDAPPRPGTVSETTVDAPDGRAVPVLASAAHIGAGASIVSFQDITPLKDLQRDLDRARRLEAIGRLTGGIAHDFNNLLTVILGSLAFLEASRSLSAQEKEDVAAAFQAAKRAAALTQQLLAFGRSGRDAKGSCSLAACAARLWPILEKILGPATAIEAAIPQALPPVALAASKVEQVLLNLTVNARDAHAGRIRIGAAASSASPGLLELTFSDDGAGMDDAVRSRLFEPFFTTKEVGKGTGLGLATVHAILTQAGGSIAVEPSRGKGTAFRLTLPVLAEEFRAPPAAAAEPAPHRAVPSRSRVLVTDDEEGVLRLCSRTLKESGFPVAQARGGPDALARLAGAEFDVLVTDLAMPGMNGVELAHRARGLRPGLKILAISGNAEESVARFGELPEGTRVLEKPFSSAALISLVAQMCDQTVPPR